MRLGLYHQAIAAISWPAALDRQTVSPQFSKEPGINQQWWGGEEREMGKGLLPICAGGIRVSQRVEGKQDLMCVPFTSNGGSRESAAGRKLLRRELGRNEPVHLCLPIEGPAQKGRDRVFF